MPHTQARPCEEVVNMKPSEVWHAAPLSAAWCRIHPRVSSAEIGLQCLLRQPQG